MKRIKILTLYLVAFVSITFGEADRPVLIDFAETSPQGEITDRWYR